MRLLLIALACLATCMGLPHSKQKRDILPGDPRYGNNHDHHHHPHENTIEIAKSTGGYSYPTPAVPNELYGPPGLQPGVPLNNDYLPPVIDRTKSSTPLPLHGVSDAIQVRHGLNGIARQNRIDLTKTVTPKTVPVVVEKTEEISGTVPSTSYGVPIVKNIKARIESPIHTHVKTNLDVIKTEIPIPAVKVAEPVPVVEGLTRYAAGVNTVPAVTTIETKNVVGTTLVNEGLSNLRTAYGGPYNVPSFDVYSHIPASFYSNSRLSFDAHPSGYARFGPSHGVYASQPLPLSFHIAKSIPTAYSYPRTFEAPSTALQVPHTLTHLVQHAEPLHTLHTLPSVPSLKSFASLEPVHPVETLAHVQSVHAVENFTPVQRLHAVESVVPAELLPPVEDLTPAQPILSVKSLPPVHAVHPVETVESIIPAEPLHSLKSLPPVHAVHPVETVERIIPAEPLHSLKSLPPVHAVHPVETVERIIPAEPLHSLQSLPPVHAVHPVETVKSVIPAEPLHSVKSFTPVPTVHSVKNLAPVPALHAVESVTPVETLRSAEHLAPIQPVHAVNSFAPVPTVHSVSTLPPVPTVHSVSTLPPVPTVHTVSTLPPAPVLHSASTLPPVQALRSVSTLPPVQALHSASTLPPLQALRSVSTLPPVQALHSASTLPPLQALRSVSTLPPVQALHSASTLPSVQAVHSVESVTPVPPVHAVESVRAIDVPLPAPIHTKHAVTDVIKTGVQIPIQRGPIEDFIQNVGSILPSLPQFPSLPNVGRAFTTPAPAVEVSSPSSRLLSDGIHKETVTVETPILRSEHLSKNVVTAANEYVQPTDANGGYIY